MSRNLWDKTRPVYKQRLGVSRIFSSIFIATMLLLQLLVVLVPLFILGNPQSGEPLVLQFLLYYVSGMATP